MRYTKTLTCLLLTAFLIPPVASAAEDEYDLPYSDIENHWAKEAIISAHDAGLFTSASKTVTPFYPEKRITRGEFLVILDRLAYEYDSQLFPLTMFSEYEEFGRGEGFDEPYLPYKDVDYLTWMYPSVLRTSVLLDRLHGDGTLQRIFPGDQLHPGQAMTRGEAAKLLQIFSLSAKGESAWETANKWKWFTGDQQVPLKRGEAATILERVMKHLDHSPILPLLNMNGQKFPLVPKIEELFPTFGTYDKPTEAEKEYLAIAAEIAGQTDDEQTYERLQKLGTRFPNQIGYHYYMSWNLDATTKESLDEAFLALDVYFQAKNPDTKTLNLLAANVYDITLQKTKTKETAALQENALSRLLTYESVTEKDSKEWQSLSTYIAALEARLGKIESALGRYQVLSSQPEALVNALYYLIEDGKREQAEAMLTAKLSSETEQGQVLLEELQLIAKQPEYVDELQAVMTNMDQSKNYRITGEETYSGYLFKYTQEINNEKQINHTTGYFQSPDALVLEKMETYRDNNQKILYSYDFKQEQWTKKSDQPELVYIHEWVETLPIKEKLATMHARYLKQSVGSYDVYTEWVPANILLEQAKRVKLQAGTLTQVPAYVTKYYVDRKTGTLARTAWRSEEFYDSNDYVMNTGSETYHNETGAGTEIPAEVKAKAVDKK